MRSPPRRRSDRRALDERISGSAGSGVGSRSPLLMSVPLACTATPVHRLSSASRWRYALLARLTSDMLLRLTRFGQQINVRCEKHESVQIRVSSSRSHHRSFSIQRAFTRLGLRRVRTLAPLRPFHRSLPLIVRLTLVGGSREPCWPIERLRISKSSEAPEPGRSDRQMRNRSIAMDVARRSEISSNARMDIGGPTLVRTS